MGNLLSSIHEDENPDYIVSIKSGNKHKSGNASHVCLVFYDVNGKRSKKIDHECKWGENFKPGTVKKFSVYNTPHLGALDKMELTKIGGGAWYVQWVEVLDFFTEEKFIFPVHRWMAAGKTISVTIHDVCLPQHDANIEQRKKELEDKRRIFEFAEKIPGLMQLTKNIPADEEFPIYHKKHLDGLRRAFVLQSAITLIKSRTWENLEDVKNVYGGKFPTPPGLHQWLRDCDFGARRLFGVNPCLLRLCTEIPDNFPVTNDMVQSIMENMTIEDAIERKKLFIINLANLEGLPCKYEENVVKICSPIALFFVNKNKDLMPVAIQLRQTPAEDNPIFLPTDPEYTWLLAKMWYCSAEATDHQSATHLGFTHFLMESIGVATHRCLSPSHPIFRLMTPHLYNVMGINAHAINKLISPDGWVDKIVLCGVVGLMENIARRWKTWRLDVQGNHLNDLKDRGVDDPEVLPNYYYRDDGLLYWDMIRKYVTLVVDGHYDTTEKLAEDTEIQEWANALSDEAAGCGIKGVPGNGHFNSNEELIETLTSLIYIGTVVHSAVNSPQYDTYSYPISSIHLRGSPPTSKTAISEKEVFSVLLDKKQTLENMVLFQIISTQGTNRLGDSEMDYMYDAIGLNALRTLRNDLKATEIIMNERSATRTYPYPYLHPREVTNSIGI